jgi:hypothetical protein
MAKKSFGIEALIQSTIKNDKQNISDKIEKPEIEIPEETKGIFINIPISLKKDIDLFCVEHGITKQSFFIQASRFLIKISAS